MIFFDISKAFDRVWHNGLLFKLKQIGINGKLTDWFKIYVSSRKQRVVIRGESSTFLEIWGPTRFNIYICVCVRVCVRACVRTCIHS